MPQSRVRIPFCVAVVISALGLALSVGMAQAKEWTEIRIGVDAAYKPFTYKTEDGKLTGFDIDIARALCEQMKAKCTFVEQNWDGIIPALNARKFDTIISSMSITDDRRRAVDFTDKYYDTPTHIVAKAGTAYTGPESLKGKRVGVLKASVQEKYAQTVLAPAGAQVASYDTQEQVYLDMKSGRLDATVADAVEAGEGFLKSADGKGFAFVGPELRDPKIFGFGAGMAVRKSDTDLRDQLNAALKAIRANGGYKKINDKYFSFDVYGQ
ncbi:MAG: ABC transporter substrate-binding protein [Burkholderiaceae bacterium]|jgi:arginine/ornithine transport system substrate-binding protein